MHYRIGNPRQNYNPERGAVNSYLNGHSLVCLDYDEAQCQPHHHLPLQLCHRRGNGWTTNAAPTVPDRIAIP